METLLIVVISLVIVARFWRGIVALIAGIFATFLGGAVTGAITGGVTHAFLSEKYPEKPDTANIPPSKDDPHAPPASDRHL